MDFYFFFTGIYFCSEHDNCHTEFSGSCSATCRWEMVTIYRINQKKRTCSDLRLLVHMILGHSFSAMYDIFSSFVKCSSCYNLYFSLTYWSGHDNIYGNYAANMRSDLIILMLNRKIIYYAYINLSFFQRK